MTWLALALGLSIGFLAGWWATSRNQVGKTQPMTIRVAVRDPDIDAALRGEP